MQKINNVLLIPDAYFGNQSGAIVARIAKKLLLENGNKVFILSSDIVKEATENDGTKLFPRNHYNGMSNWKEKNNIIEFKKILNQTEADVLFTIGSITNKNLCYLEIAKEKGLKVISKIFMQDFFCTKFYANTAKGPCTKCLDNNFLECFISV